MGGYRHGLSRSRIPAAAFLYALHAKLSETGQLTFSVMGKGRFLLPAMSCSQP